MVANRKVTGCASSIPAGLAAGAAMSMGITLLTSILFAVLISAEHIRQDRIGYCSISVLLLASLTGSCLAIHRIKKMPLQIAVISGVIYYLMLLSATALFFGGQYQGMGVTAAVVLIGSGAGGMLVVIGSSRRKQKSYKKYHR